MYQQKDNEFSLFKNKKKRDGKRDPDYTGSGMAFGMAVWINAWLAKSKAGETYMQCRLKPRQTAPEPNAQRATEMEEAVF